MQNQCGLVNSANPCRCSKKTQGFAKAGYLNPEKLLLAREHVIKVREVAEKKCEDLDALDAQYAEIHRDHPFQAPPDFVAALRALFDDPKFKSIMELDT
jgi:hypothetical protein